MRASGECHRLSRPGLAMCAVLCCGVRLGADELRLGEITQDGWIDRKQDQDRNQEARASCRRVSV